jgi:hypothetical protein
LQRAMDRSKRATNPQCFNTNGTWKKGQKFSPSKRYPALRTAVAEIERKRLETPMDSPLEPRL